MDLIQPLQANCEALLGQYRENLGAVLNIQDTFCNDILPELQQELDWDDDAVNWARDWLKETYTIFLLFRRHKFTRSFTLEALRKNLIWRMDVLRPCLSNPPSPILQCLPNPAHDPFHRPIAILKAAVFARDGGDEIKSELITAFERSRARLRRVNAEFDGPSELLPVMQYVILLDLADVSVKSLNIDLVSWTLREVIPRFPGMLAGVFMVNFSWTHSGLWTLVKRLLPTPALSRVFFPSQQDLLEYFSPSCLPADYGGLLPSLNRPSSAPPPPQQTHRTLPVPRPKLSHLSSTSFLNPFFGYPITLSSTAYPTANQRQDNANPLTLTTHTFHHGRRRKRDLVRTLAVLFWERWGTYIQGTLWIVVFWFSLRRFLRTPRAGVVWASFWGHGAIR